MDVPTGFGRSISSTELRRHIAAHPVRASIDAPPAWHGRLSMAALCDAMRDRWAVDATLHREAIFFEALDRDIYVIRHGDGTHIERRMSDADDDAAALALGMNPTLFRRRMAFGVSGPTLVLHRYVTPWESLDGCLSAVRDFVVVSDRIKRELVPA